MKVTITLEDTPTGVNYEAVVSHNDYQDNLDMSLSALYATRMFYMLYDIKMKGLGVIGDAPAWEH